MTYEAYGGSRFWRNVSVLDQGREMRLEWQVGLVESVRLPLCLLLPINIILYTCLCAYWSGIH